MAKIEAGTKLTDFSFDTPFESGVKLSDKVKEAKKTVLLFLRYYGCTLCQLDIREYANAYEGEEMQLPGYFILNPEMEVLECHRAASILDMPTVDEMIAKL